MLLSVVIFTLPAEKETNVRKPRLFKRWKRFLLFSRSLLDRWTKTLEERQALGNKNQLLSCNMIRWFSPHPLKSCWLLYRCPLPLLWHLSDISAICNFWPQLQFFEGVSWPPWPGLPEPLLHSDWFRLCHLYYKWSGDFQDNVIGGNIRSTGVTHGVTRGTPGSILPTGHYAIYIVYTLKHQWRNTGGKGLVGQVEKMVGKSPPTLCMVKSALPILRNLHWLPVR